MGSNIALRIDRAGGYLCRWIGSYHGSTWKPLSIAFVSVKEVPAVDESTGRKKRKV